MKRLLILAASLSLLLPVTAMAQQQHQQGGGPPGPGGGRPPAAGHPSQSAGPGRPQHGRPSRPQASHGRPGGHGRPVTTAVRPLPPRGNQFWHRGKYYPRIHGPAFVYPRGYAYRRWTIGARLPALFFAPTYFYAGYAALGLQPPPPGYQWVRYGPDLLLVNLRTGEVEDVVYGVFM